MGDVKQIKYLFRFIKGQFSIVYTTKRTDTEWYRYCEVNCLPLVPKSIVSGSISLIP